LVEAGVARSRSHALRWCVRLVADKQDEWLADLRKALEGVEAIRREGPRT
jgi:Arc/MetJ-type ribon-helix-helix transcriptional regulator